MTEGQLAGSRKASRMVVLSCSGCWEKPHRSEWSPDDDVPGRSWPASSFSRHSVLVRVQHVAAMSVQLLHQTGDRVGLVAEDHANRTFVTLTLSHSSSISPLGSRGRNRSRTP